MSKRWTGYRITWIMVDIHILLVFDPSAFDPRGFINFE